MGQLMIRPDHHYLILSTLLQCIASVIKNRSHDANNYIANCHDSSNGHTVKLLIAVTEGIHV